MKMRQILLFTDAVTLVCPASRILYTISQTQFRQHKPFNTKPFLIGLNPGNKRIFQQQNCMPAKAGSQLYLTCLDTGSVSDMQEMA